MLTIGQFGFFSSYAPRFTHLLFPIILCSLLSGCSNVIRSGLVNSNTIFLDPGSHRTVYLQVRNVSENQRVNLGSIGDKLIAKGYQLVTNPEQANYWIQTKVVYCHKAGEGVKPESLAQSGFASGISTGGATGGMIGGMFGMTGGMMPGMGGGSAGSMGGMDMERMMRMAMAGGEGFGGMQPPPKEEGVTYLCVTDAQITDRKMGKSLAPSSAGSPAAGPRAQHMRMVGHVLQKDLDIAEATPIIQEKFSTGIAGLF